MNRYDSATSLAYFPNNQSCSYFYIGTLHPSIMFEFKWPKLFCCDQVWLNWFLSWLHVNIFEYGWITKKIWLKSKNWFLDFDHDRQILFILQNMRMLIAITVTTTTAASATATTTTFLVWMHQFDLATDSYVGLMSR